MSFNLNKKRYKESEKKGVWIKDGCEDAEIEIEIRIDSIFGDKEINFSLNNEDYNRLNFIQLKEIITNRYLSSYSIQIIIDYFYDDNKVYSIVSFLSENFNTKKIVLKAKVSKFLGYTIEAITKTLQTKFQQFDFSSVTLPNLNFDNWLAGDELLKIVSFFDSKYCSREVNTLSLDNNLLDNDFLFQFAKLSFINLNLLKLGNNAFSGNALIHFIAILKQDTLQTLDLNNTDLSKLDLERFFDQLNKFPELNCLNLNNCNLNFDKRHNFTLHNKISLNLSELTINNNNHFSHFLNCFNLTELNLSYLTIHNLPYNLLFLLLRSNNR
ncbi:hypothetical protein K502DRAFT_118468 [Neoconidiobolus thromboides FSU 785]|nr:hypothetical protein K502DRAFT_118468 [Neoconidiobolus thromboides FSU 785]